MNRSLPRLFTRHPGCVGVLLTLTLHLFPLLLWYFVMPQQLPWRQISLETKVMQVSLITQAAAAPSNPITPKPVLTTAKQPQTPTPPKKIKPHSTPLPSIVQAPVTSQTLASQKTETIDAETPPITAQTNHPQTTAAASNNDDDNAKALSREAQPDYAFNPPPIYPKILREQAISGVVSLRVLVASSGLPEQIHIAHSSGYRLMDDAALRAVRNWKFIPALQNGSPNAGWVEFPIRFTLES